MNFSSAKGFKESVLTASGGGGLTMYCNRVFGAWDYCIVQEQTAELKHRSISQELKVK